MRYFESADEAFTQADWESLQSRFRESDNILGIPRNTIKVVEHQGRKLVIKSFKVPHLINRIAYRHFRKSKARRSFEHATRLMELGIGTPAPVFYEESRGAFMLGESYYGSELVQYDLLFSDLVENPEYPGATKIITAFTAFTHSLHEKKVLFLDHSTGNTLMTKQGDDYTFSLVDLNRMQFKELTDQERLRNLERLTPHEDQARLMGRVYGELMGWDPDKTAQKVWDYTHAFQERFWRKQRMKKKLVFWK